MNYILSVIRRDINDLELNGITVTGLDYNIKGTVVVLVHDNLAAHTLLGMQESFRATYPCRFCKMPYSLLKSATSVDDCLLRENYNYDDKKPPVEKKGSKHSETNFGLKRTSELLKLVLDLHLITSTDPFHDLNEGVIHKDLLRVFKYLIEDMKILEATLVSAMQNHDFGVLTASHKPENLKVSATNLGQSGAQTRTLLLNFPHIFGRFFTSSKSLKVLNIVQLLIKIVNMAYKRTISNDDLKMMESTTRSYLSSHISLFGSDSLSPKHHFLCHYVLVMKRLGPSVYSSTAPFESKHTYFTSLIKKGYFSKNIVKYVCRRHQFLQAIKLKNKFQKKVTHGVSNAVSETQSEYLRSTFNLPNLPISSYSWIKYVNKFAPHVYIRNESKCLEILQILEQQNNIYLLCKEWDYEEDEFHVSTKLKEPLQESKFLLNFNCLKELPTFNKIRSSVNDNNYILHIR